MCVRVSIYECMRFCLYICFVHTKMFTFLLSLTLLYLSKERTQLASATRCVSRCIIVFFSLFFFFFIIRIFIARQLYLTNYKTLNCYFFFFVYRNFVSRILHNVKISLLCNHFTTMRLLCRVYAPRIYKFCTRVQ